MLIADGGGGSVPPASVPAATPTQPPPATTSTQADAAARARELQRQLDQMLERLREAQRRAEEARQRALEAQQRAETARQAADAARKKADKSQNAGDQAAAAKAQQDWKLQDARMKKAAADADLQAKDVALQRAQVAQKREQVKSPDGKASAAADQKVQDAQHARDTASKTNDLAKLYADAQEKQSKAQDAEARVASLRPRNRFEAEELTPAQRSDLSQAQADASRLRGDADAAQSTFATEVDKDADTAFYGGPPATPPGVTPATAAAVGDDPLHSPLLQLLQVSPASTSPAPFLSNAPGSTLASGTTWNSSTTFSPLFAPANAPASPQLARTLSGLADGKSLAQVASDQHMSVDQVVAQARAAGVDVQASAPSDDVQVTTLKKGDVTLAYTHNLKDGSVTVKGAYADASAPGGQRAVDVSRNRDGVFSQTVQDPKTGRDVIHQFDPAAGTRTDIVTAADKTRTETTTDLTAAPVAHTVQDGEGYLKIAKDAGLTPEQLLALNPDVDYGAPLKPGQQLVVVGAPTTVKIVNPDQTTLERSTASDGTLRVVFTDASGQRNVLMGDPDPTDPKVDAIRKALFDDKKSIAQTAASLGMTEDQLIKALPPGTVDDTPASADNQGIRTRTIYDAQTNRTFIEIDDPRHDRTVVQEIQADQVFHVRQLDPKTGKYVLQDVKGGAGYAQSLADQRQATADDYGKQISDIDATIRLYHHTGDDPAGLLAERARLVALQKDAQGQASIAQGKANAVMTRHERVQVDQSAAIAYQNWFVARPGSKDQAAAAAELQDMLALSDKVDRLVASSDKDVGLLVAGVDKQRADDAKSAADDKLQAAFQDWKANDWGWGAIPKEQADRMKAQGQRAPYLPYYQDAKQENDAAWSDFCDMQKEMDKYGTDGYPPSMVAAHDAWVQRNQASDAALKVDMRFDDASSASNLADQNVLQGDIARLQQDKANWMQANPTAFSENFDHQGDLDQLNANLAQHQVDALNLGEDRKFTQFMTTVSAPDREDPEGLKKAEQKYAKDNQDETTQLNRSIDELQTAGAKAKAKAADDYIAAWKLRNPELRARLDALGSFDVPNGQSSVRAIEYRQEQTGLLLGASEQGKQLQSAMTIQQRVRDQYLQRGGEDVQHVTTDRDAIKKDIDGHTFVRDLWDACGGDDAAKDGLKYTDGQLDKATQLRDDLASGKISVSDYASKEDSFLNSYDHDSGAFQRRIQDSDGTWSVVDEAVRTTVSAAAGIAATIASGGNVAVGFAVGLGVSELWDTTGDIVAAAQGRDVNADGHTSLWTLEAKAVTGNASWDDVKFTLKDEALDVASNAVTLTGVGAGARMTESLTAQLALKDSLSVGGRTLLKVGLKEGSTDTLTWGGRAIVGAGAGVTSQAVDGLGRVGVETLHVGLDGQLGTAEGDARITSTIAASATGLLTAPVTGAFSGAIPLKTPGLPGLGIGGQILNDTAGSLGTGELVSLATEGRSMNRAEFIAASLNIGPSVLQHVAIHPMMARAQARAEAAAAARDGGAAPRPLADVDVDDVAPGVRLVDDDVTASSDTTAGRPVVLDTALPTRVNGAVGGGPADALAAAPAGRPAVTTTLPATTHAPAATRAPLATTEPDVGATTTVDLGLDLSPVDTAGDFAASDAAPGQAGGSPAATARQQARRTRAAARTERDLQAVDANRREPLRSSRAAGASPAGVPGRGEEPAATTLRPGGSALRIDDEGWDVDVDRLGQEAVGALVGQVHAAGGQFGDMAYVVHPHESDEGGANVDGLSDVHYVDEPGADPALHPIAYDTLEEALAAARPGAAGDRIALVPHEALETSADVPAASVLADGRVAGRPGQAQMKTLQPNFGYDGELRVLWPAGYKPGDAPIGEVDGLAVDLLNAPENRKGLGVNVFPRRAADKTIFAPGGKSSFEGRPYSEDMPVPPGLYALEMHGWEGGRWVEDASGTSRTAAEIAPLVAADPKWGGRDLFLIVCQAGEGRVQFAQELANALGVNVYAANGDVLLEGAPLARIKGRVDSGMSLGRPEGNAHQPQTRFDRYRPGLDIVTIRENGRVVFDVATETQPGVGLGQRPEDMVHAPQGGRVAKRGGGAGPGADADGMAGPAGSADGAAILPKGAIDTDAMTQPALFGDVAYVPPRAPRPVLDKAQGQQIADLVHMAGSTDAQGLARKTVGLTELADGRIAVTISGKEAGLNPNQRRVAVALLVKAGFEPDDVIMMDGVDDNPNYARPADRHLDPDERSVCWHAEHKGIQAGKRSDSPAVRQWSASGRNPSGPEEPGHGGAACPHCQAAQADYGVVNETGLQPPKGQPPRVLLADGKPWGGRDDRVDTVLPGIDWESYRERPVILDATGVEAIHAEFTAGLRQANLHFADDPAGMLFRLDTQSPDALRAAGGVLPRPGVGLITEPSLSSYVEANTPGRWVGTSKSVRHIAGFVADNPQRVKPGETARLYVLNPPARSRHDVLAHYEQSGRLDALQPPIREAVQREGEVAVDGGMPWSRVYGWAEVDPATGRFVGAFQRNPDYAPPVVRSRRMVTRMPDEGQTPPPASTAAPAPNPATPANPTNVVRTTLPDLSSGWQPVLRTPQGAAPPATPALFVVQHAGSGPRSVFDPASGQWIPSRAAATPAPGPAPAPSAALATPVPVAATTPPPPTSNPPAVTPAAPAPKAPPTRRRVYGSAAAGILALGGLGTAAAFLPPHILGTAFSWATAGAAMRSGVKFMRFSQARRWEGRVANMGDKVQAKAAFEQSLDKLGALGERRRTRGADPAACDEFAQAVAKLRDQASRVANVPLLRRAALRKPIAELQARAVDLRIPEFHVTRQTSRLKALASDRAAFDRNLALHERFVVKGKKNTRTMRWLTGFDGDKAKLLETKLDVVNTALGELQKSGNNAGTRQALRVAVHGLSVAPNLRDKPNTVPRVAIDAVQAGTYAISLGSLAESVRTAPRFSFSAAGHVLASAPHFVHALATTPTIALHSLAHALTSVPTAWPGVVVSSVFAVSTLADGGRILGSRIGAIKAPQDREPVTTHALYAQVMPRADDTATVHGGVASVVKGALFGEHKVADTAAALAYAVGAWRQRREARGRGYVDPQPDDLVARKKVFNRKIVAAGAGLVLATEALASQWLDGEKKKKDALGPATPPATPAATSPPVGTTTTPGPGPTTPVPTPRSKLVVVDAADPRTAALWGIAHANESSLLPQSEIHRVQASAGDDGVTLAALRQLFQLNPQRGFKPALMDGVPSAQAGDPDTIQPGWKIEVQNPAVS